MKNLKVTTGILAMAFLTLTVMSCKDAKKEKTNGDSHAEISHNNSDGHHDIDKKEMAMIDNQDTRAEAILKDYFNLKDALVGDDNDKAKKLGGTLVKSLKSFDASKYSESEKSELNDIIEDATEHAEHISESDIKHQREHFKVLSKDVTDMVAITGTGMKLYEQFCPMYDNNKGGAWLSMNEEIRNPYFGDQMLKCGKVQREIN
ncbi:DUF3347 domain-containing protein [Winogradskyella helgolandensis]|uniref:DUF3347 domain-containing protein n=1 Tax=Winogradskyella helgolandensis TaxID=2697010 RepID=UPI0015BE5DDA|nr:DUF3347 domain-containing protein [Winogradskyella helgolandensis]